MGVSVIDVGKLLQEVSPEAPCGDNLEYDQQFIELETAAQEKPEQQFGSTIIPAEPPDWAQVQAKAAALLSRTKDLRIGVYLAQALAHTSGFTGLRDSLGLLRLLLEQRWDTVHPQLDPADGSDPTMRVNALAALNDPIAMLRSLRELPLVSSRRLGRFALRDIFIAKGELAPGNGAAEPIDMATIDAAFMDAEAGDIGATMEAVREAIAHGVAIEAVMTSRVGAANAPSLGGLVQVLRDVQRVLAEQLARRGVADTPAETGVPGNGTTGGAGEAAAPSGPARQRPMSGQIESRDDVIQALDRICEYYKRHEPSSPVPLLVQRARRLVSKDFMEALRDLVPESVAQVEKISGTSDAADKQQ